ncbi:MAG: hypothetical protein WBE40_00870 [Thermoplasmata archaeon]
MSGLALPSLEVHREVLREALGEFVADYDRKPAEFESVIERAIDHAFGMFPKQGTQLVVPRQFSLRQKFLLAQAKVVVRGVLEQTKKFTQIRGRIKSLGAVVVAGAGLSYSSEVPLTAELADALRFAGIDVTPAAPTRIEDLRDAFARLKLSNAAMVTFREQFGRICAGKPFGPGHFYLANELGNHVIEIVSLNWDDLIEKAAPEKFDGDRVRRYDKPVGDGAGFLWKFHGDVKCPCSESIPGGGGWVYPFDGGFVFESFKDLLAKNPRLSNLFVVLVIGYGEGDEAINRELIGRLSKSPVRPVVRVGLSIARLHEADYLVGPCDYVLRQILDFGA